ncbi:MAG: NUDIX domain-containing protein [Paracoccaceae bacterium]
MDFAGSKLALFVGDQVVALLRDDLPHIAFADHWDLPGGFAEAGERPETCAIRETYEEVGAVLRAAQLRLQAYYPRPVGTVAFFTAHLPANAARGLRLGDEGQRMELMTADAFITHARAVPHLQDWLAAYLRGPTPTAPR